MRITRLLLIFSIVILSLVSFSTDANAQRRKRPRVEVKELRVKLDSIKKEVEHLRSECYVKDSVINELMDIYRENEDKSAAGLNPEDYSPEITDSLLSIWYLHRQVNNNDEGENYDMDSIHFSSSVSDTILKQRLENLNSFITLPYNETVRNFMILYSEKMPTKMSNILGLCNYYMPIFEETFSNYKLPDELKYVAIIESALNPVAVSRAGAKGMWQFMMKTAKSYGLEINSFVDERLDPFKSADAAARYLTDSYTLFGDWNLAISSYNCGPGNVNKAIRRAGSRDFWSVYDYLPRETRGYVPAFVGAMYAIKYAKESGLVASNSQMPIQLDTFEIRHNLHFQQISELVGISVDELRNLNPQYIQDIIPGNSGSYVLRLPFNFSSAFIANEDSIYTYKVKELMTPQTLVKEGTNSSRSSSSTGVVTYVVKKGDYLGKIAAKYHVTVNQIKKWNNLKSNTVAIGKKLQIYGSGSSASSSSSVSSSSQSSSVSSSSQSSSSQSSGSTSTGDTITYVVKSGDSLYGIANKYPGVTVNEIMKLNGVSSNIRPGMKLKIPRK